MKLLNDINVVASKEFIELMALKTEADGMIAENKYMEIVGKAPLYGELEFRKIVEKMRALKPNPVKNDIFEKTYEEVKDERPSQCVSCDRADRGCDRVIKCGEYLPKGD